MGFTAALELQTVPKRFLIIGGGIIGLEMAQIYSALGSEITIVEMLDQIIPPADKDLVQPLFLKLKKKYTILTKTKVTEVTRCRERNSGQVSKERMYRIKPNLTLFWWRWAESRTVPTWVLKAIGLQMDKRGFIQVNERQETNVPHIYAIGDVVGEPMLAHKATHEGKVAAEVIAGHKSAFTAMTIPSVAYTNPEVAWMGLTEKEAKAQGD